MNKRYKVGDRVRTVFGIAIIIRRGKVFRNFCGYRRKVYWVKFQEGFWKGKTDSVVSSQVLFKLKEVK